MQQPINHDASHALETLAQLGAGLLACALLIAAAYNLPDLLAWLVG